MKCTCSMVIAPGSSSVTSWRSHSAASSPRASPMSLAVVLVVAGYVEDVSCANPRLGDVSDPVRGWPVRDRRRGRRDRRPPQAVGYRYRRTRGGGPRGSGYAWNAGIIGAIVGAVSEQGRDQRRERRSAFQRDSDPLRPRRPSPAQGSVSRRRHPRSSRSWRHSLRAARRLHAHQRRRNRTMSANRGRRTARGAIVAPLWSARTTRPAMLHRLAQKPSAVVPMTEKSRRGEPPTTA